MRSLSLEQAVALVRPADRLAVPLGPGQPCGFLHALGNRDDWTDLRIISALLLDLYTVFAKPGVKLLSGFFGPVERTLRADGHDVHFIPGDFRRFADIVDGFDPRIMLTAAAPADSDGRFSLSLHAGATIDSMIRCGRDPNRILILETHPDLPRTRGLPPEHPHSISAHDVDVVVESDRPVPTLEDPEPGPIDCAISGHIARFVSDGSTLQTGIGSVPSRVAKLLADGDGGDYGIHSEMFTTGLMHLHQAGKVTNRKGLFDGFSVATFALGSADLHRWLDENDAVRFLPVDQVNTPALIGRNRNMVSINGAIAVDLASQVVADTIVGRQFSGIGGHEDFVGGASLALGGRSIVCLPSTTKVGGRLISRIQATLPVGSIVTTPRHQLDIVITEFGAAELCGRTVEERAIALAEIAHPDFRDELRAKAAER